MALSHWLRAVRIRFFLSDLINVANGIAIAWGVSHVFNVFLAALTFAGILLLRGSVNLMNDYFDHIRGVDDSTVRTPFSGGSGVIQEGSLEPGKVYRAGILLLLIGVAIGVFLAVTRGPIIIAFLAAGALAVYFYTTRVTRAGLSEVVVIIERALIIIGSFYVQAGVLTSVPIFVGFLIAILFASVIFLSQFPDVDADAKGGRRGVVIRLGVRKAAYLYPLFPFTALAMTAVGVFDGVLPFVSLLALATTPGFVLLSVGVRRHAENTDGLVPLMAQNSLLCSLVGLVFIASFII